MRQGAGESLQRVNSVFHWSISKSQGLAGYLKGSIESGNNLSGDILNIWSDLEEKADFCSAIGETNLESYYERVIDAIDKEWPGEWPDVSETSEDTSFTFESPLKAKKALIIDLISKKARYQLEEPPNLALKDRLKQKGALGLIARLEQTALSSSSTKFLGKIEALKSLIEISSQLDRLGEKTVDMQVTSQDEIYDTLSKRRGPLNLLELHKITLLIRHFYALSPCADVERRMEALLKKQIQSWIPADRTEESELSFKRALSERHPNVKESCIKFEQLNKKKIEEAQGRSFNGLNEIKQLALRKSSKEDIAALQKRFTQNRSMHYSFSLVFNYFLKNTQEKQKSIYEKIQSELNKEPEDNRINKFKELAYQEIDGLLISSPLKRFAKWYLSCSLFIQSRLFSNLIGAIIEEFDTEIKQTSKLTNKEVTQLAIAINQSSSESFEEIKKNIEGKFFIYQNKILQKHLRFKPVKHLLVRPARDILAYIEKSSFGHKLKAMTPQVASKFWKSRRGEQVKSGIIAGGELLSQIIDKPCNLIIQWIVKVVLTKTRLIPNTLDALFKSLSEEDFLSSKLDNLLERKLGALEEELIEDSSFKNQSRPDDTSSSILSIWNDLKSIDTNVLPFFRLNGSYTNVAQFNPRKHINYYNEVIRKFNKMGLTLRPSLSTVLSDDEELQVKKQTIIELFFQSASQQLTDGDHEDIDKINELKEQALRQSSTMPLGDIKELQTLITFKSKLDKAYEELVKASSKFLLKKDHLIEFSPVELPGMIDPNFIERKWIAPQVKEAASKFLQSLEKEENRRQLIYTVLENLVDPEQQFPTEETKAAEKAQRELVKASVEQKLTGELIPKAIAHYTSANVSPKTSSSAKCIEFLAQHFPDQVRFDQEHKQPSMPNAQPKTAKDLSQKFIMDGENFQPKSLSEKREQFSEWQSEFETFLFQLDELLTVMKNKLSSKDACMHIKTFNDLTIELIPFLKNISNELKALNLDPNKQTREHIGIISQQFEHIKNVLQRESILLNAIHRSESQTHFLGLSTSNKPAKVVRWVSETFSNTMLENLCKDIAGRALTTIHDPSLAQAFLENITATTLTLTEVTT